MFGGTHHVPKHSPGKGILQWRWDHVLGLVTLWGYREEISKQTDMSTSVGGKDREEITPVMQRPGAEEGLHDVI